ncbi:MAG: hypothetical protein H7Y09_11880 [Chitinophagaceae bacterium]|nr:hypothetical protein [Anaerolineae bacterium]
MSKDFKFDDDLDGLDDFDDDLSAVDENDPDRAIERFDAMVDQKMKLLISRKEESQARVEAAYWLGESGAPKAITVLRKVYKGERDKKIQKAAGYALGMFKALDEAIDREGDEPVADALQRDENSLIRQLLEGIVLNGDHGKRKRLPTRTLILLQGILVLTLIGLIAANVLTMNTTTSTTEDVAGLPTINPTSPIGIALNEVSAMQQRVAQVRSDAEEIQRQYTAAAAQPPADINCTVVFNKPLAYTVPSQTQAEFPEIAGIAGNLNTAINTLSNIQADFDSTCQLARQPLPVDLADATRDLPVILNDLTSIETALETTAEELRQSAIPTATPIPEVTSEVTEAPTITPTATIEPTPTLNPVIINSYLRDLNGILDAVSGREGARTLLLQYWTDVANSGATDACRLPPPPIPENYGTVPTDVLQVVPTLQEAVSQLNLGLDLLRQGWTTFREACQTNTLTAQLSRGQQVAQLADSAFNNVTDLVNAISNR